MKVKIIVSNNDQQALLELPQSSTIKPRAESTIKMLSIALNPDYALLILNEMPVRIDHEMPFSNFWLLSEEDVKSNPEPYQLLPNYSQSKTIWEKGVMLAKDIS